jgi:hypothetical protein
VGGRADVLVLEGPRRRGRCILAGLLLRGDDGLQVLALPPLLAAVAVRGLRDLFGLVDGGLLDVGAIHIGLPRHALGCSVRLRVGGCGGACACGQALRSRPAGLMDVEQESVQKVPRRVPRAEWLWLLHCAAISSIAGRSA